MNKILITGANGQLGNELRLIYGDEQAIFTDVEDLDITDSKAVKAFFNSNSISVCINAAAYTAVDKAESEQILAGKINTDGPQNLAKACHEQDAMLVQVSTDFVFDGEAFEPYRESDPIRPLGVYGMTKAEGESRALQSNASTIVIRTSWLYSSHGNNFMKTMFRLGAEKEELKVVEDQHGVPTWARDLANAIAVLVSQFEEEALEEADFGVYHFSNAGQTTWSGFASQIMKFGNLPCKVTGISTKEYPTPAKRPKWSVLDCRKIVSRFEVNRPSWEESLEACMKEYAILIESKA
ncbi:MAG: dTDP-4-dehydrorhamnose reductase, partial [Limisphaerales bacterium]